MRAFELRLTGKRLLMHSDRLVDTQDPITRELAAAVTAAKKSKTEADEVERDRLEFMGGLYWDAELGPYIPTQNIARCLREGGTPFRLGKAVVSSVLLPNVDAGYSLIYRGPRTPDELWAQRFFNRAAVGVNNAKVMRVRPMFLDWSLIIDGELDTTAIDPDKFEQIVGNSSRIGLGDWRPTYGQFTPEVTWK
jgi:hypothetical protein